MLLRGLLAGNAAKPLLVVSGGNRCAPLTSLLDLFLHSLISSLLIVLHCLSMYGARSKVGHKFGAKCDDNVRGGGHGDMRGRGCAMAVDRRLD